MSTTPLAEPNPLPEPGPTPPVTGDASASTVSAVGIEGWRDDFTRAMMQSAPAPLLRLDRGDGCRVWDSEGNEYLDFLAGIAVNSLGHGHPAFVAAASKQAATLAHVSNYFA